MGDELGIRFEGRTEMETNLERVEDHDEFDRVLSVGFQAAIEEDISY